MTTRSRLALRRLLVSLPAVLFTSLIPYVTHAQSLETVIDELRDNSLLSASYPRLDAMVACIVANNAQPDVAFSFEESAGLAFTELRMLVNGSEAPLKNAGWSLAL